MLCGWSWFMFGWNVNPTYSVNMAALTRRPGRSACVATASTMLYRHLPVVLPIQKRTKRFATIAFMQRI